MTSTWGELTKYNRIYKTEEQIEEENINTDEDDENFNHIILDVNCNNGKKLFVMLNKDKPYKTAFARLKPFLTSYGRNIVSETAFIDFENVVRICTDGICFKTKQDFKEYGIAPVLEDKTTGYIKWVSVNEYYHKNKNNEWVKFQDL